jgi:hypothetical protein
MNDIQTTTKTGAANSSDPRFDSFFATDSIVDEPPREELANAPTEKAVEAPADQVLDPAEPKEAEAPTYASLNEMLAAHKIDPESVMGLHVTAKIDGIEKQVPLAEVMKSYQLEGHVNNKSIELSNQRVAFEQEQQAIRTLAQQQIQQNRQLGDLAMQMLNADFGRVDWNTLRVQNPAEYAALQAEYQNRQGQIQNYMGQMQQQAAHAEQQQQQALQQSLSAENERLLGLRPEWRDPQAFSEAKERMTKYARSAGFKDAELNQIFDHRYMVILDHAARYQELQAANPQVLKQVRQAPKMAAPGSRTDVNPSESKRRQVVERLNRNPRDPDAQAAAFDFFANQ